MINTLELGLYLGGHQATIQRRGDGMWALPGGAALSNPDEAVRRAGAMFYAAGYRPRHRARRSPVDTP